MIPNQHNDKERGFSLLEVLVALMVLSIGLLGIATMQVGSLRLGQDALFRTKAVNLTADMADRIRANPGGSASYVAAANIAQPATVCADNIDGEAPASCTPIQMAAWDIFQWQQSIDQTTASGLPGGNGRIVRDGNTVPPTFTITVNWVDRGVDRNQTLVIQQ